MPTTNTNKNIWSKLALSFSIFAILTSILFISFSDVPIGILLAIFSITFAINDKYDKGKFSTSNIVAIIFSILALLIGIVLFLISLKLSAIMHDPIKANIYIQSLKDFISQLPADWQAPLNELYGF